MKTNIWIFVHSPSHDNFTHANRKSAKLEARTKTLFKQSRIQTKAIADLIICVVGAKLCHQFRTVISTVVSDRHWQLKQQTSNYSLNS